jgi:hypothetical protein
MCIQAHTHACLSICRVDTSKLDSTLGGSLDDILVLEEWQKRYKSIEHKYQQDMDDWCSHSARKEDGTK